MNFFVRNAQISIVMGYHCFSSAPKTEALRAASQQKLLDTDDADETDSHGFDILVLSVLIRSIRLIRVQKDDSRTFRILFWV